MEEPKTLVPITVLRKLFVSLNVLPNTMTAAEFHRPVASFLVESLVYNCPDTFFLPTWTSTVKQVISHIWESTQGSIEPSDDERWLEVNKYKYLFSPAQKWTRKDARDFAYASWNYLELAKS